MEGEEGVVDACKAHGLSAPQEGCTDCQAHQIDCDLRASGVYLNEENEAPANVRYKGKVAELRSELTNSGKKDKNHASKKNALKKIVANMTMSNNDMVALFPDVINCMQIPVLEIKKMLVLLQKRLFPQLTAKPRCFLYLQNYARQKPDIALRALPILQEVSAPLDGAFPPS